MTPSSVGTTDRYRDENANDGERTYALFNHLVGLLSLADQTFIGLLGAIIMWQVRKKDSPFLDDHGREAVNFQLSLLLYLAIGVAAGVATLGIGFALAPVFLLGLAILRLIGCIRGAMAAHRGEFYRYPMCIRFME